MRRILVALIAMLVLPGLAAAPAAASPSAAPGKTGDQWEVTTTMSMEGMAMPARTQKVCSAKEWKEPPAPASEQQKCTYSDFKVEGPKATWKVRCANPEMTGEGEITRKGADAYSGAMKFTTGHGAMTMKLEGKRLGDCDLKQ